MSEISNNTDNILSNFHPCLRKNIEELCLRSTVGFLPLNLEDISITTNFNGTEEDTLDNFHFVFKIPYAGKRLRWDIIFDPEDFYFAPDFDFNDEEFLNYPDTEALLDKVPSWKNWNLENPKVLAQVLNEFLNLYKKHQIEKLHLENKYSRYSKEYHTLISGEKGIEEDKVQINVEASNIVFFIIIPVDCSSMPEYIQPVLKGSSLSEHTLYNHGDDYCHLKISISKLDGTRSNCSVQLSPRLEQLVGHFRLPFADIKKDTSLLEIVSSVQKSIQSKLQQISDHYKLKKIYIMNLAAVCVKCMIEYDVLTFNKSVFMYSIDEYNCLVSVTIGPKFPQEKPTVVLTSIYCQDTKSCTHTVKSYPYSPAHKPEVNVEKLLEYLYDVVQEFKEHKH